jgi:hypothetical protein
MAPLRPFGLLCLVVAIAFPGGGRCDEPPLRPIAEVLALPVADLAAGVPVRVRGIVVSRRLGMALQDGGVGIWVRGHVEAGELRESGARRTTQEGDMVEVEEPPQLLTIS